MADPYSKKVTGRSCYGHLGGKLGQLFFERLIALGWLTVAEGRSTVYELTPTGYRELEKLGIALPEG